MSDNEQVPIKPDTSGPSSPASEAPSSETSSAAASPAPQLKSKIDILLKATGDAPIMKKRKWAVEPNKKIGSINEFIKKYLKCSSSESLFLYINQSFAPSPDVEVGTLYECFGSDGKLVVHYCLSQAWG